MNKKLLIFIAIINVPIIEERDNPSYILRQDSYVIIIETNEP